MFEINGIQWKIVFVHPNSGELHRTDGSLTVGMTDWGKRCVFLSDALRGAFLRKVFIHEVCHCAVFSYGISLDIQQEEFLCDFIASYGDEIFAVVDDMFSVLKKAYIA